MTRIGLTGGIGCGKSTAARWLASRGILVIDTDDLARQLVEPGQEALWAIVERFGAGILRPDGTLDRAALGTWVFRDAAARQDLEGILHPRIQAAWLADLNQREAQGHAMAVVVIPLLFEKGYHGLFDVVVAMACSGSTQRERLRQRGWADAEIDARNATQWSMDAKMQAAGKVIWSEGSLDCLHAQLSRVFGVALTPGNREPSAGRVP